MSSAQRAELDAAERRASDIHRDPSRLITRDSQGNPVSDGRRVRADGSLEEPAPGNDQPTAPEPAADRPKIRLGNSVDGYADFDESEIQAWREEHARQESRRLSLPPTADLFEVRLPDSWKPPEAFKDWKPDPSHYLMAQAKQLAHDASTGKISGQQLFSEMLALNSATQIGSAETLRSAREAEIAKLGANATLRVTAVQRWIAAQVGDDLAKATEPLLATSKMVEVWEKVIAKFKGADGSFSPSRGPAQARPTMDDATWNKMSYSEKKDYAAKFSR
jgi:hypothetical protein